MAKRRRRRSEGDMGGVIYPTFHREAQARAAGGGIEVAEPERVAPGQSRAFMDADGRPSRPWRVVDTLMVLERRGAITAEQRGAGERFRAMFEMAGLAGVSAAPMVRRDGGDATRALDMRISAGREVDRACRALGRTGPIVVALVDIVGRGMGMRAWEQRERVRNGMAAFLVAEALAILVDELP